MVGTTSARGMLDFVFIGFIAIIIKPSSLNLLYALGTVLGAQLLFAFNLQDDSAK